jgi:hypothetical protein
MRRIQTYPLFALLVVSLSVGVGCHDPDRVDDRGNTVEIVPDDGPTPIDLNGDGQPDAFDTDGDGEADAVDLDNDGVPDAFDTDGDGELDDWNGDGIPDPVPPGVDNGDPANESSDGDGYCFSPEAGWYECDDGADPGSGVPGTPQLGDPNLGGPPEPDFPGGPATIPAMTRTSAASRPSIRARPSPPASSSWSTSPAPWKTTPWATPAPSGTARWTPSATWSPASTTRWSSA